MLGTDGLYEKLKNEEICELVVKWMEENEPAKSSWLPKLPKLLSHSNRPSVTNKDHRVAGQKSPSTQAHEFVCKDASR